MFYCSRRYRHVDKWSSFGAASTLDGAKNLCQNKAGKVLLRWKGRNPLWTDNKGQFQIQYAELPALHIP